MISVILDGVSHRIGEFGLQFDCSTSKSFIFTNSFEGSEQCAVAGYAFSPIPKVLFVCQLLSTARIHEKDLLDVYLNNTYRRVPTVIPPPQLSVLNDLILDSNTTLLCILRPRLLFINVTVMPAQRTVPKSMQNVLVTHLGTVMLWAFIGVIFALIAPEI